MASSVIPACAEASLRPENAITFGCAEKLLEVAKEQEKKTSKLSGGHHNEHNHSEHKQFLP